MAGSSLLLLLDDIAAVLDDVAAMTKVAARKTAGVLGDDLAVNAEKVTGVRADRELPVVWAGCQGLFSQQTYPGAGRAGFVTAGQLDYYAPADDGWPVSVLRGL